MATAKITIELTAEVHGTGSKLVDVAHDAYAFRKLIPDAIWTSAKDKSITWRMGDSWAVTDIRIEQDITDEPRTK